MTGPVCSCGEQIKPCAPCCRHGGWLHKTTGHHECVNGPGVHAFPARRGKRPAAANDPAAVAAPGED